ncbi:hypothetical protein HOLleu_30080 [Holothuria leucospilota]|uniref:Transmembrane protein n=1 Tax=Holothuria leucospilota TaxID=206669 RepID=A0A9Q1GZ18_HOLLE|nr:hypothetical protein HOLleu_30080 [Holothuria leucospilota]
MSSFDETRAVYSEKDEDGYSTSSFTRGVRRTVTAMKRNIERSMDSARMWTWRQWIRPVFAVCYFLVACGLFCVILWDMLANYRQSKFEGSVWVLSGTCALFAIGVSCYGILSHVVYFSRPNQQRYIVRILFMVPIYSIDSSIVLRFPASAIFLDSFRACYQAFVVYCFMFYLLHYLSENYDLDTHLSSKPRMKSPKPFCCFKPGPNSRLVHRCRNGVLNFVIIGPLTTLLTLILYFASEDYTSLSFAVTGAWLWVTIVSGISQINFCISIEMALMSVIHLYAYPHKPFKDDEPLSFRPSCRRLCDYSDMKDDIRVHSGRFLQNMKKRKKSSGEIVGEGDTALVIMNGGKPIHDDVSIEPIKHTEDRKSPEDDTQKEIDRKAEPGYVNGGLVSQGLYVPYKTAEGNHLNGTGPSINLQSGDITEQLKQFACTETHGLNSSDIHWNSNAQGHQELLRGDTDVDVFGMSKTFEIPASKAASLQQGATSSYLNAFSDLSFDKEPQSQGDLPSPSQQQWDSPTGIACITDLEHTHSDNPMEEHAQNIVGISKENNFNVEHIEQSSFDGANERFENPSDSVGNVLFLNVTEESIPKTPDTSSSEIFSTTPVRATEFNNEKTISSDVCPFAPSSDC